ncbi:MAG: 4Fe-4S binding protein [Caldilineaceae bacterium]|nr:4Fe-4S binding protein [Caldilineaceae bacterium]
MLLYPDRCTYCTACEDVCPTDAIALPFLIVFAEPLTATRHNPISPR